MAHTLIVTAVVLLVYGAAAVAVLTIYHASDDAAQTRSADTRLARTEADAARRLIAGRLDRAAYRRTMAALAACDAVAHPLTTPEPPRQD